MQLRDCQLFKIMKNCLVIDDLDYLQNTDEGILVGGYVSAGGSTSANTNSDSANASANAYASGDSTYTDTRTRTVVKDLGLVDYSSAKSTAKAYARSGNETASYWSDSSSISIELDYS